ncbi:type II secretion system protein [Paraglaciecola sp.]|uniref:type IV pilus modification PilV family protein n=1 Tax=Paraglaciecola sp. TaxID=1920173 RepID=UPI0030F39547
MNDFTSLTTRKKGFTLVEVLVSFLILTFSLTVIYESFMLGSSGIARAEHQAKALILAQSALDLVGAEVPLVPGETVSSPEKNYEVRVRTIPFEEGDHSMMGIQLYEVEVRTLWQERSNLRQLSIRTLKWATKE